MADEDGDTQAQILGQAPPEAPSGSSELSEGLTAPLQETREEVLQRHRKETKELQAKDMALKKTAAKGSKAEQKAKKKAIEEEISKLDAKLKARHAKELASLGYGAEEATASGGSTAKVKQEVATLVNAMAGVTTGVAGGGEGKLSKGQKRREKRMQQDAEREQRISEEKNGLVSHRMVEGQRLKEKLQPLGLTLKEIKPDGHCLYRAVEDQLSLSGVRQDYQAVRAAAASYMRQHVEDFLPFVVSEQEEGAGSAAEQNPSVRFQKYCQEVESTAAWGGHLELEALAHALHRHIVVISADLPDVHMGVQEGRENAPPIRLSYHRHEYGLGEHYNSVVPIEAEITS